MKIRVYGKRSARSDDYIADKWEIEEGRLKITRGKENVACFNFNEWEKVERLTNDSTDEDEGGE